MKWIAAALLFILLGFSLNPLLLRSVAAKDGPDEGAESSPALAAHRSATARDGGCHSAWRAASASSIEPA